MPGSWAGTRDSKTHKHSPFKYPLRRDGENRESDSKKGGRRRMEFLPGLRESATEQRQGWERGEQRLGLKDQWAKHPEVSEASASITLLRSRAEVDQGVSADQGLQSHCLTQGWAGGRVGRKQAVDRKHSSFLNSGQHISIEQ